MTGQPRTDPFASCVSAARQRAAENGHAISELETLSSDRQQIAFGRCSKRCGCSLHVLFTGSDVFVSGSAVRTPCRN